MRAAGDHPAAVEDHDLVAVEDGRQSVRDHEERTVGRGRGEGLPQERLVAGVQAGGRLVQEQQRRAREQRAGDRQPLALPARQQHPLVADQDVQSPG